MKKLSVKKSERMVKEYAPAFGLAHYRYTVTCLPEEAKGRVWGRSHYDHSEEFFDIQVVPDGTLGDTEHRHLILHELAHGLAGYSALSKKHEETVCDRLAKLVLGPDAAGPNFSLCGADNGEWPSFEECPRTRRPRSNPRKDWDVDKERNIVKMLDSVPDLTDRQRYVLGAIYVQGHSFREVARALGVSPRTVTRVRDQLVKKLAEVV